MAPREANAEGNPLLAHDEAVVRARAIMDKMPIPVGGEALRCAERVEREPANSFKSWRRMTPPPATNSCAPSCAR